MAAAPLYCSSSSGGAIRPFGPPSPPGGRYWPARPGARLLWGAASQTRPRCQAVVGRDDPGAPNHVLSPSFWSRFSRHPEAFLSRHPDAFSFVILRPEAEGSVPSSAPSSGPAGHLPPSGGKVLELLRSGVWDRETGEGRGRPGDRTGVQL